MSTTDASTYSQPAQQFAVLTEFLRAHRRIWEPRPFVELSLPWEVDLPEVSRYLRALSWEAIEQVEADGLPASAPPALRELESRAAGLTRVPDLGQAATPLPTAGAEFQVHERKRGQLEAFCRTVLPWLPAEAASLLDWCGGKGHLGRTLALATGRPVTGLERQAHLCHLGEELARRSGTQIRMLCADALASSSWELLQPGTCAVALHACGQLTTTLIREGVRRGVSALAASPCCPYYQIPGYVFTPLSAAGQAAGLPLGYDDLRLAVLEETVSSPGVTRRRRRQEVYRLGFDLLAREASGRDCYHSLGHLPQELFHEEFGVFCRQVAIQVGLPLPPHWDPSAAEAAGWERARMSRALSLFRAIFRRPLECWLALERALFLQESGYQVQFGTFCERAVTPRNLLILARS